MENNRFTVDEAASYLGFRKSYLYRLMHDRLLSYYRPNHGRAFFAKDDLDAFLNRGRRASRDELEHEADKLLSEAQR